MHTIEYLDVYEDYFWTWEQEEEVICIPGGSTIAYFQFVLQILEDLADQGLPPFGALLLAITATNYSTDNPIAQVERIVRKTLFDQHRAVGDDLPEAIRFLQMLSSLPLKYTTGAKRVQLFQLLFSDCHRKVSKQHSQEIASLIRSATVDGHILLRLSSSRPYDYNVFYQEFRCIALLSKRFPDANSLISQLAGVPAIEEPILEEEEERAVPGDFIEALIDHPSTFPIGVLIKSLWSGMSIPIHHTLPSAQPLGGFSDLSNKGDFDKLLISEFAGDDWLFLSRLANNEALYLHREAPPGADRLERIILIDVSLKSWGTPKILSYAVLLAIARHPKTDIHCTAFAVGKDVYPVAVDTVDEVIQSIQLLDGSLHPAEGLVRFFEQSPAMRKTEVFFIASADTMRHPAIQKVISDYYHNFKYWVTVSPEGKLLFYRNQHKGKKLIQQLSLPLEQLWEQRRRLEPTRGEETPDSWKVPILFPPPTSAKKVFVSSDFDLFAVTKERSLLSHRQGTEDEKSPPKGWKMVLEEILSSASHFAMGPYNEGKQLFLCFRVHNRQLTIYRLDTGENKSIFFNEWKPSRFQEFFFAEQEFYYMNDQYIWSFTFEDEIRVQRNRISGDPLFAGYYDMLQERAMQEKARTSFSWSVLKNVNNAFINVGGNLVFNKHELVLSRAGHIQLLMASSPTARSATVTAEWAGDRNEFTFPGGNKIKIHRSGMLILQRVQVEERQDSVIYIPAALDASLAAATDTKFAGNPYYYPSDLPKVLLKMSTARFYEENIRSFIQDILHAASRPSIS
ncbi:MAG: hypothetical protein JST68_29025 [Bacteroidetes bacterium]|nr:hypothetical protein [Bacteroidota bacterium]